MRYAFVEIPGVGLYSIIPNPTSSVSYVILIPLPDSYLSSVTNLIVYKTYPYLTEDNLAIS